MSREGELEWSKAMDGKQLIDVAEHGDVCVRVAPEGAAFVLNLSTPAIAFLLRKAALVPLTQGGKGSFHFPQAGLDVIVEYEALAYDYICSAQFAQRVKAVARAGQVRHRHLWRSSGRGERDFRRRACPSSVGSRRRG